MVLTKRKVNTINPWQLCLCGGGFSNNDKKNNKNPHIPRFQRETSRVFDISLSSINMRDLAEATNNFHHSKIIGDGGFGLVYFAELKDGRCIAIKKLAREFGMQGSREFEAEIETLGKIKHPNLVELLAYCKLGEDRALVYEFVHNRSLDNWLHERDEGWHMLDWHHRLKIALGAARGLSYLHHDRNPHILHRDIKSSNILLDHNFEPKIADFGLARLMSSSLSHVTTDVAGTFGYMAPEYAVSLRATKQADVYSFGVLMLEIVSGRRPDSIISAKGFKTISGWASNIVQVDDKMSILDPLLITNPPPQSQVHVFLSIACKCVSEYPQNRPTMKDVFESLSSIR